MGIPDEFRGRLPTFIAGGALIFTARVAGVVRTDSFLHGVFFGLLFIDLALVLWAVRHEIERRHAR